MGGPARECRYGFLTGRVILAGGCLTSDVFRLISPATVAFSRPGPLSSGPAWAVVYQLGVPGACSGCASSPLLLGRAALAPRRRARTGQHPRHASGWPAGSAAARGTAARGAPVPAAAGYYYGIARVGGDFLTSALTGPALLIVLATPVWAVLSWLAERPPRRKTPEVPAPVQVGRGRKAVSCGPGVPRGAGAQGSAA